MLHIDTRELHPGLIMSACRLSKAKEREMKEERRRRRSKRRRWRRRGRRRSGKGEVKGREEQQAVQPRVPGGAQMFIPVDLSSPLAPPVPLFVLPDMPPSPPVLAEKERALGNPVLRSVASTLCVLLLLGCTHSGVAIVSLLSTDGNMTGSIAQRKTPDIDPRCVIYFRIKRIKRSLIESQNLIIGATYNSIYIYLNNIFHSSTPTYFH